MNPASLRISGAFKRYGEVVALAPTDLDVPAGEFLTLLGPSGSGKTTLLGVIAGLIQPDGGEIRIGGRDITHSPSYERDIGMVFQNYALFPHMTVADNVGFPLRMRRAPKAEIARRVAEALDMVRLPHVAARLPRELSGGQQQRIALARCLVFRPPVVLMDEPLGALDKKLRDQMQLEIKRIHRDLGATIVYVTHDQEEAMTMSDRICLMNGGRIEQLGSPHDIYFRPRTLFAADFLGESNLLPGRVLRQTADGVDVVVDGMAEAVRTSGNGSPLQEGLAVQVMVRPQTIVVTREGAGAIASGEITDVMVSGGLTKLHVRPHATGLGPIVAAFPTRLEVRPFVIGETVGLGWRAEDAVAIPIGEAGLPAPAKVDAT